MKRSLFAIIFSLAVFGTGACATADTVVAQATGLTDGVRVAPAQEVSDCSSQEKDVFRTAVSCTDAGNQAVLSAVPQACLPASSRKSGSNNLFTLSSIDNGDCMNAGVSVAGGMVFPEVPVVINKNVESFISYFQTRGRKHFERWMGRSKDYMAMLQTILTERGLPEEISYIAFIESGLNPTAKSHANAVGMWQFIKGSLSGTGVQRGRQLAALECRGGDRTGRRVSANR